MVRTFQWTLSIICFASSSSLGKTPPRTIPSRCDRQQVLQGHPRGVHPRFPLFLLLFVPTSAEKGRASELVQRGSSCLWPGSCSARFQLTTRRRREKPSSSHVFFRIIILDARRVDIALIIFLLALFWIFFFFHENSTALPESPQPDLAA